MPEDQECATIITLGRAGGGGRPGEKKRGDQIFMALTGDSAHWKDSFFFVPGCAIKFVYYCNGAFSIYFIIGVIIITLEAR